VGCHVRLRSIGVGHRGLGVESVDVADIGREGVGWYWPGDGVAVVVVLDAAFNWRGRRVGS
jgi:hypothetical protein